MPIPRAMAKVNRKVFNPRAAKSGKWPVLIHVGRSSGQMRETPLDAHEVDGGYIFIANYGAESDWVKNILAAGKATLRIDGEEILLEAPRMVPEEEALGAFTGASKPLPTFLNVHDYLRMDSVS